jgi:hypothetical protein
MQQQQVQRIYCGTKLMLPQGYDRFASPYECLRKGVGVGKNLPHNDIPNQQAQQQPPPPPPPPAAPAVPAVQPQAQQQALPPPQAAPAMQQQVQQPPQPRILPRYFNVSIQQVEGPAPAAVPDANLEQVILPFEFQKDTKYGIFVGLIAYLVTFAIIMSILERYRFSYLLDKNGIIIKKKLYVYSGLYSLIAPLLTYYYLKK